MISFICQHSLLTFFFCTLLIVKTALLVNFILRGKANQYSRCLFLIGFKQTCCRFANPQLSVIFFYIRGLQHNKNITRYSRHPSLLIFFFTQVDISCNKITIKDNRQGVCFLRLIFKMFMQIFLRKSLSFEIIVWNYSELKKLQNFLLLQADRHWKKIN